MNELVSIVEERYGVNELVLVEDLLALYPDISRQAVYKKINAALEEGTLERYGRGSYYIPSYTRLGKAMPSAMSLVQRKWLQENGEVTGYISGAALANSVGITEQVPAVLEVVTNRETTRVREVPSFGGWKRIRLRCPRVAVTSGNVDSLRFLDLITSESVTELGTSALQALRDLASKAGRESIYECAAFYPNKTSKRLIECEAKGVFA